jgi:hypothetical protein
VSGHEDGHGHGENNHGHLDRGEPAHGTEPDEDEERPDASAWIAGAQTASCPACGAARALMLGGGIFCPTCGEVTTNPGYEAPPDEPPSPGPDPGEG